MEPDYWGPGALTQGTNPPPLPLCSVWNRAKCDDYLLGDGPTYQFFFCLQLYVFMVLMCMLGPQKSDQNLTCCTACFGHAMFASWPCDCDFLIEVLQRNGHDLHASPKAELSDSVSSDVNFQMYTSLQCLTSGGLIQCYIMNSDK